MTPLDVPFFKQEKDGCGAASVAMVAHYWERSGIWERSGGKPSIAAPSPEQAYKRLFDSERRGVALAEMKRYFQELGYHAFTFRGRWTDLEGHLSKRRPVIVGLEKAGLHYAILVGVEGNHVWLNDPARRQRFRLKKGKFEEQWKLAGRWILLATPARSD